MMMILRQLSRQIAIKIGVKVMIRRNVDATLGLVNSTIATVSVIQDISIDCTRNQTSFAVRIRIFN